MYQEGRAYYFLILCFTALFFSACQNQSISTSGNVSEDSLKNSDGLKILQQKCAACHTSSFPMAQSRPMMDFMTEASKLADRRYIIAGKPELSIIYQRIADGDMPPPPDKPLSSEERLAVRNYILSLKKSEPERKLISENEVLIAVLNDLNSFPPSERVFKRYLSLTDVHNDISVTDQEYSAYKLAIPKLMNSLSWNANVLVFNPLSSSMPVYRIDIRFFENSSSFANVDKLYTFGFDTTNPIAAQLVQITGSSFPVLRADWFIYHASQSPLYEALLNIPATRQQLETKLGINVNQNIISGQAVRTGFNNSGVSLNNRMMERHTTTFGGYWLSYDFANEINNKKLVPHPLGPLSTYQDTGNAARVGDKAFNHDGGEIIFNLPNGLQAYLLVDAAGNRINQAPFEIVSDPNVPGRIVTNGISCNTCHNAGIIRTEGIIRNEFPNIFDNQNYPSTYLADVLTLYKPESQVKTLMDQDSTRHVSALERTGNRRSDYDSINIAAQSFRLRTVTQPRGL